MTSLLQLIYADDDTATIIDSLNLLDYQFGFQLAENGWTPKVAVGSADNVIETITLRVGGSSQDDLATHLQILEDWIVRVTWSALQNNRQRRVWLKVKDNAETNERISPILEMSGVALAARPSFDYDQRDSSGLYKIQTYVLTIRRGAFWEPKGIPLFTAQIITVTNIAAIGGYVSAGQVIIGDVAARAVNSSFGIGDTTTLLTKIWLGWRTSNWGTLANFVPVWSLKDSTMLGTGAATAADAGAYSGTRVTVTFGTNTFIPRVTIKVDDVTANDTDQRGNFIVLLRAKSSDASTFLVRIASGYAGGSAFRVLQSLIVSGTSYQFFQMGAVSTPASEFNLAGFLGMPNSAIRVDAKRLTGAGDLHLDCLQLIPYTDGYIKIDVGAAVAAVNNTRVLVNADGIIQSATADASSNPVDVVVPTTDYWSIPANNEAPYLVVAAQRVASQVLTDLTSFSSLLKFRWRTMRGTE